MFFRAQSSQISLPSPGPFQSKRNLLMSGAIIILLCAAECSKANSLTGYVDGFNSSNASGWACLPFDDQAANVAIYVGPNLNLIGVFPPTVIRTDVEEICGGSGEPYGFSIYFSPNLVQQLIGQTQIKLQAVLDPYAYYTLPPSTQSATNPFYIPSGYISSVTLGGTPTVTGIITGANGSSSAPPVQVYAGGPMNEGGTSLGYATSTSTGNNTYQFSLSSSVISTDLSEAPTGFTLPITAYVLDADSAPIPLSMSVPITSAGAAVAKSLPAAVQQQGSQSGLTNTIFTSWISSNSRFAGLSGAISLTSNTNNFNEALVEIGSTPVSSQTACNNLNGTSPSPLPSISRLAGFILKNTNNTTNGSGAQIPFSYALPYSLPLSGSTGTCLITLITAGYPYLIPNLAQYTDTASSTIAWLAPAVSGAPTAFSVGLGNEF